MSICEESKCLLYRHNVNEETCGSYGTNADEKEIKSGGSGWWGWVVVAASFTCLCVLDGIGYTFGVFLAPLMEDMECGRGGVSAAGSFQVGVYSLTSLVSARLVTVYGTRPVCSIGAILAGSGLLAASQAWNMASLLSSYSLVTGVGFGLMYVPSVVAVAQHVTDRQALALGVCVCGSGMGTFILAPMENYLLKEVGWRWTFIAMAGLCFLCTLCSTVMTPVPDKTTPVKQSSDQYFPPTPIKPSTDQNSGTRSISCCSTFLSILFSDELLASPALSSFVFLAGADCLATLGLFIPFAFLPDEAHSAGIATEDAAFLVAVMGISSSVGRLLSGWVCDQTWCNPIVLTAAMVMAASVPPLIFPWISLYSMYLALCSAFGLLTGVWIAATSPMLVHVLGLSLLSPAFGLMTAAQGGAALIGPPLAGMAIDLVGDRGMGFHLAGAILGFASLLFVLAFLVHNRRIRKLQYKTLRS